MDNLAIRQKLLAPYAGMADPYAPITRSPISLKDLKFKVWRFTIRTWFTFFGWTVGVKEVPQWRVSAYADVHKALTAWGFTHNIMPFLSWLLNWLGKRHKVNLVLFGPVTKEGRQYRKLRRAFDQVVSPEGINRLQGFITHRADAIVRQAAQADEADVARLADQLTYEVVCKLLGMDTFFTTDEQRTRFFGWLDELMKYDSPFRLPPQPDLWEFLEAYITKRLQLNLNEPIDRLLRNKFRNRLVVLWYRLRGKEVPPNIAVLVGLVHFIMTAGTVTSAYAISATWALLITMDDREVFEKVKQDALTEPPNEGYAGRAYQEGLRFATPSRLRPILVWWWRRLGGRWFWPGQIVEVNFVGANHDPRHFMQHRPGQPAPTSSYLYDPLRVARALVAHIAFGAGKHMCPGRGLSGKVAVAMITALFRYMSDWTIESPDDIEPAGSLILRMAKMKVRRSTVGLAA